MLQIAISWGIRIKPELQGAAINQVIGRMRDLNITTAIEMHSAVSVAEETTCLARHAAVDCTIVTTRAEISRAHSSISETPVSQRI